MSLIEFITTEKKLLSERDRIGTVLEKELSIKLGPAKLNERVAKLLGAKDWNTALGTVKKKSNKKINTDKIISKEDYRVHYITVLNDWINEKLHDQDIITLISHISSPIAEMSNEPYECLVQSTLYHNLCALKVTSDIWYIAENELLQFGLNQSEFDYYIESIENGEVTDVIQNNISEDSSEIVLADIDINKSYNSSHIIESARQMFESREKMNTLHDFELIDTCNHLIKLEQSIISHETLKSRAEGFSDHYVLEIIIENDLDENRIVFSGEMYLWNCENGNRTTFVEFDNTTEIKVIKDGMPDDVISILSKKLKLIIDESKDLMNANTYS